MEPPEPVEGIHFCDIRNYEKILPILEAVKPEEIYHLAAQSSVRKSVEDPISTYEINFNGSLNLLEAVRNTDLKPKILLVSSCEVYGVPSRVPLTETDPLQPCSPYAASKTSAELMGYQYWKTYGIPVIRTRPCNHTGAGQLPVFALPSFAKQIVEIERGKMKPVLLVGDLSVQRDYLDVEDVVRAYVSLMESGTPGDVYNVTAGSPHRLSDLLKILLSFTGKKIEVRQAPDRLRKADIPLLSGSSEKLTNLTGWTPRVKIEKTLEALLDFYRSK